MVVALAMALSACGRPDATRYALHAGIPLGHVTLKVTSMDVASLDVPTDPEDRLYAVHVSCSGLPSVQDVQDRREYFRNLLERQLSLVDSDGDRFRPTVAEDESSYASRVDLTVWPSLDDRFWVVVFVVPEASRDFTLEVRNPDRVEGQPALAAIHLGMPSGR